MRQVQDTPPGYAVPIHASLWRPMLLGGVPQEIAVLNFGIWMTVGMSMKAYIAALLGFAICWIPAVLLARDDPQFFAALKRHLRHRDFRRG